MRIIPIHGPDAIPNLTASSIAAICHEANRRYCAEVLNDPSQVPWEDAPAWQRQSAINGVISILSGKTTRPEQSHENWLAEKVADGWTYGAIKNVETKQHPCIMPFAELAPAQRMKDLLFFAIVTGLTVDADL